MYLSNGSRAFSGILYLAFSVFSAKSLLYVTRSSHIRSLHGLPQRIRAKVDSVTGMHGLVEGILSSDQSWKCKDAFACARRWQVPVKFTADD